MLNESSYVVRYELSDGEQVERSYNHRAAWRLDRGFMVGPEHGWQHDPVTILEVERHPDLNGPGAVTAQLFRFAGSSTR